MSGPAMGSTGRRRALGALRTVVGIGLAATLLFQIADLALGGGLVPEHYFLTFTIDSSFLEAAVLTASGITALRGRRSPALEVLAAAIVPYGIVTGVVYTALLRGLPSSGYQGLDFENEVVHVVVPIVLVLDWFVLRPLAGDRTRLSWRAVGVTSVFPLAWLAVTLLRGAADGWYPYPFLDPATAGWASVLGWIVALTIAILVIAALAVLVTRLGPRRSGGRVGRA
jgi:hypothetical protein